MRINLSSIAVTNAIHKKGKYKDTHLNSVRFFVCVRARIDREGLREHIDRIKMSEYIEIFENKFYVKSSSLKLSGIKL